MIAVETRAVQQRGENDWLIDNVGEYGDSWEIEWIYASDDIHIVSKRYLFVRESDAVAYVLRWM